MMICGLHTLLLLGAQLVLSVRALTVPTSQNNFFYHDFLKGNSKKESTYMINEIMCFMWLRNTVLRCDVCIFLQFISEVWSSMWTLLSHQCLRSEGEMPPCHAGFGTSLSWAHQGKSGLSGPGYLLLGEMRQTCWCPLAPVFEVLETSGCWKENHWNHSVCLCINSQSVCCLLCSGVVYNSDRISQEMLHSWWLNSS